MEERAKTANSYSYWRYGENMMEALGPIAIITQQLQADFADSLNRKLRHRRQAYVRDYPELAEFPGYLRQDYRIAVDLSRFRTGEGKAVIRESVRGHDLFIISDVLNYGIYASRFNNLQSYSPDEHFQDLVRIIIATHGIARRINVIMPYLYEGRRYQRITRGSSDCAQMLKELFSLGIENFITFDAHDERVANAVPYNNFESFPTALYIIEKLLSTVPDIRLTKDDFMVISPKETGISRAIYYATLMRVPLGTFYREHHGDNNSRKNFLGDDVSGRDVLIVDDMIDTAETMCECASILKEKGAKRIFCAASFPLFTRGLEGMNQLHDFGIIDRVFSSNLCYQPAPLRDMPWFESADFSGNVAAIIDALNHNASLSKLLSPEAKIVETLENFKKNKE